MNHFLVRFAAWATLATVLAWTVQAPWERTIASIAARIAAPSGSEIEVVDLEVFYPYDLAVFTALCLASAWATWRLRGRAIAIGVPILVLLEIVALIASFRILMDARDPAAAERTFNGIIRMTGPVSAAALWLLFLGRERLSLTARRWLGDGPAPS